MNLKKSLILFFIVLIAALSIACTEEDTPIIVELVEGISEDTNVSIEVNETQDLENTTEELIKELIEEKILTRLTPETYLGIWMPSIPGGQSLENSDDLISISANTVEFGVIIPYSQDGSIYSNYIEYDQIKSTILNYKNAGLAIAISLEPIAVESNGEPGPIPNNIRENFLDELNKEMPKLVKLFEETKVEIFAPLNEQDYKLGIDTASNWGQEILPVIKKGFSGKILWKGSLFEHVSQSNSVDIDFSGYDIVGFTSFPFSGINQYPSEVNDFIETISGWAQEDGVNEIFISEFGSYEPVPISKNEEPDAIRIVFEESNGRVKGFFVFDPPQGFGTSIKGTVLENVVKEEFEKLN